MAVPEEEESWKEKYRTLRNEHNELENQCSRLQGTIEGLEAEMGQLKDLIVKMSLELY